MNALEGWPRRVLVISLALNLFLAGVLGTWWWRSPRFPGWGGDLSPGASLLMTEGARKPVVEGVWQRHGGEIRRAMGALRTARHAAHRHLAAPEWNEAEVARALGELRAATLASQEAWHGALVETARHYPPEQRARLALGFPGGGKKHGGRGCGKTK